MTDPPECRSFSTWVDAPPDEVLDVVRDPAGLSMWLVRLAATSTATGGGDRRARAVRMHDGSRGRVSQQELPDADAIVLDVELDSVIGPAFVKAVVGVTNERGGARVTVTEFVSGFAEDTGENMNTNEDGEWDVNRTMYAGAPGGWVETRVWNRGSDLRRFDIEMGSRSGPVRLELDLLVRGCVLGSVEVPTGRRLQVNGSVLGDVVVERGGRVEVNGFVSGDVRIDGGRAVVRGVLEGTFVYDDDADVTIEATAFVAGKQVLAS